MIQSVLTADFVGRTEVELSQQELSEATKDAFVQLSGFLGEGQIAQPFRISRGDSFQGVLHDPRDSLKACLFLRLRLRATVSLDLRQAIGIGPIEEPVGDSPLESSGTAFIRSGRLLDEMSSRKKPTQRIAVRSGDHDCDAEFLCQFELLESIISDWTDKEAQAILFRLQSWTQSQIAAHLSVDQSAIHRRLKAAHWDAVAILLDRWESAVAGLSF